MSILEAVQPNDFEELNTDTRSWTKAPGPVVARTDNDPKRTKPRPNVAVRIVGFMAAPLGAVKTAVGGQVSQCRGGKMGLKRGNAANCKGSVAWEQR